MNVFVFIFSICFLIILFFSDHVQSSNRLNGRTRCTNSHKHRKITKQHRQLYGVSLSSITGFEKPMFPPKVINNDLYWDVSKQQRDAIKKEIDLISRRKTKYIVPSAYSQVQLNSNETSLYNDLLRPTLNSSIIIFPVS